MIEAVEKILGSDRQRIEDLLGQVEFASSQPEKLELLKLLCSELSLNAALEDEVLLPLADDELFILKSIEENKVIQMLVKELSKSDGSEENLLSKVKVLAEFFRHHAMLLQGFLAVSVSAVFCALTGLGLFIMHILPLAGPLQLKASSISVLARIDGVCASHRMWCDERHNDRPEY